MIPGCHGGSQPLQYVPYDSQQINNKTQTANQAELSCCCWVDVSSVSRLILSIDRKYRFTTPNTAVLWTCFRLIMCRSIAIILHFHVFIILFFSSLPSFSAKASQFYSRICLKFFYFLSVDWLTDCLIDVVVISVHHFHSLLLTDWLFDWRGSY